MRTLLKLAPVKGRSVGKTRKRTDEPLGGGLVWGDDLVEGWLRDRGKSRADPFVLIYSAFLPL